MTVDVQSAVSAIGVATPAPWWGVPVVAGIFLLVGAVLGFVFNRANDKRKAAHERDEALAQETLDLAAQFLELGNRFAKLGRKSVSQPIDDFLPTLVEETTKLMDEHGLLFTRFRLVMPKSLDPLLRRYAGLTVALVVPPFDHDSMWMRLDLHSEVQGKFINALREIRGLSGLDHPDYKGAQTRVEAFADRMTDELAQHIDASEISVNRDETQ